MIPKFALLAAASILAASCNSNPPANPDTEQTMREWRVNPAQVDPGALRASVKDPDVRRFYEATGWKAAWTEERAGSLLTALGQSSSHGLKRTMFLEDSAPDDPTQVEAALTAAAMGYAKALAHGFVDPSRVREVYTVPRPKIDAAAGLRNALAQDKVGPWLGSLAPQTPEYRALSEAFLHYWKLAEEGANTALPAGEPIEQGDTDPRVPALAEALRTNGYLPEEEQPPQRPQQEAGAQPAAEAQEYTAAMAEAVKRMQAAYGIKADGIVGEDTLEVLNTSAAARARQLAVNMERLRWLDRTPPATRVDVNTAAAVLDYWRDGQHRDQRRVVVGQPDWETPQLGSPMFQLVANPTWTVPQSIEEEEIAPKGPGYLAANNMVRKNGRIVQQPGPKNALGQVKFDMRNDEAIYLHDTPAKALFAENERHRSHGCVRVHDALGFAGMIARDDGILEEFRKALATGDETFVDLNTDIPVRLMYHTAFLDRAGRVRFRTDAYGWDDEIAVALGLARRATRRVRVEGADVGP